MTAEKIQERLKNRIQDLHATINVVAREYAEARAANDEAEARAALANYNILQELLEAAYSEADTYA